MSMKEYRYTAADMSVLMTPQDVRILKGDGNQRSWTWPSTDASDPADRLVQSFVVILPLLLIRRAEKMLQLEKKKGKNGVLLVRLMEIELHDEQGRFEGQPIERPLSEHGFELVAPSPAANLDDLTSWATAFNARLAHRTRIAMNAPGAPPTGRVLRVSMEIKGYLHKVHFDHPWI